MAATDYIPAVGDVYKVGTAYKLVLQVDCIGNNLKVLNMYGDIQTQTLRLTLAPAHRELICRGEDLLIAFKEAENARHNSRT